MFFSTVKMTSATDSVHPQLSFKHQGKWIHALFLTQCRHAGCGFLESFFLKQRKQENHRDCSGDETKVSLGSSKLVETSFGSWMLMVICWWGVDLMLYHVDDIDVFKLENASQQALVGHQMGLRVPYWREKECVSGWKISRKWQEYNGHETKIIQYQPAFSE